MEDIIIRIGQSRNKQYIVLRRYSEVARVDAKLIQAIIDQLNRDYDGHGWKEFDHVEIVGYVKSHKRDRE